MSRKVSASDYRDAMARYGAAVSVVTTADDAGRCGFTASAICSVTDDPPTLLVCMNRSSSQHARFAKAGVLCVNALTAEQQALSVLFSSANSMEDRFAGAAWSVGDTGAPILTDALVSFDCAIETMNDIGTHSVLFCSVKSVRLGASSEGLIYFGRAYHRLSHKRGE